MRIVFDHIYSSWKLQDFNLELESKGCTVLYDPCEKLSPYVLTALVGLDEIVSGHLSIDGQDIAAYFAANPLLSVFGYVFDEGIMLSNLTIKENLLLPWRKRFEGESEKSFYTELNKWLQLLDLQLDINLRPAYVSHAENKFMGYIRALMLKPKLLLIDDPFYLFNKAERQRIYRFIREIKPLQEMLIASADDEFLGDLATQVIDLSVNCR